MELAAVLGFIMAGYAVIANDSVQTLGTWINSNKQVKWYWLWLFASAILIVTLLVGYLSTDMSWGRLDKIPPITVSWYHLLAPIALIFLTRKGIPVSTSFLVLSTFASSIVLEKMLIKSVVGYILAATVAYIVWLIVARLVNESVKPTRNDKVWRVTQWGSTGFLWFTWLTHDIANIMVFLPRSFTPVHVILITTFFVAVLGLVFYRKGGKIQEIVINKKNTRYVRSATIIDLVYALLLLYFKQYNNIPMSTTFVFVGLLAGRELALAGSFYKKTFPVVTKDLGKLLFGMGVSLAIVFLIHSIG